jgi:thioredoxin 1
MAIDLDRDNYENEVLKSALPVMVDFWGPQCRPCLALTPTVEKLEKEYEGKLKVGKVSAPTNRMLCAKLRVMGLPAFLFYKNGTEFKRVIGETTCENDLLQVIKEIVN